MEYSFTVTQRPKYLHIQVAGTNSPETVQRYLIEVHDACVKHNATTVLVEENLAGPSLNIAEMYWQISNGSRNIFPIRCIAFVDINPEHDASRIKFAETVALNRGVNMRVFGTLGEAESWLDSLPSAQG